MFPQIWYMLFETCIDVCSCLSLLLGLFVLQKGAEERKKKGENCVIYVVIVAIWFVLC